MSAEIIRNHLRNGEPGLARVGAEGALDGASDDDRGQLLALLSRALLRLGQPRQALRKAEAAAEQTAHWEATLALGEALVAMGEAHPARALLTGALSTGSDDAAAAVQLNAALAEACRAAGDPVTGIDVATRAVMLAERTHGIGSPDVAEALHGLGVCLHAADRTADAAEVLKRALQLRVRHAPLTSDHATTLDALGSVRRKQSKPFDAVKLHRQALEIWRQQVGERAGPVGACRHQLAQALHRTGDFVAAKNEMEAAYGITVATLGPDHVDTWICAFELGRMELDIGMPEEGIARMTEARGEVEHRLGARHPVVLSMNAHL